MQAVIIFNNDGNTVVISVATHIGMTTLEIGQKGVSVGLPFVIIDTSIITNDYVINPSVFG
ncbi:TPA: hypothetical protein SK296_001783 [Yersinia enterocolitica]|nr:hypothetical protein [Yersinia enterocolitica]